jgi:hypothetical protein
LKEVPKTAVLAKRVQELIEKITAQQEQVVRIRTELSKMRLSDEQKKAVTDLEEYEKFVSNELPNMLGWSNATKLLSQWDAENISPARFHETYKEEYGAQDDIAALNALIEAKKSSADENDRRLPETSLGLMNASSKEEFRSAFSTDKPRLRIHDFITEWQETLKNNDKLLETIEEEVAAAKAELQSEGIHLHLGISFYSINQFLGSFKDIKDAAKSQIEQWNKQKEATLAPKLSHLFSWIPGGGAVQLELDAQFADSEGKIQKQYADYLASRNISLKQIISDRGLLHQNRNNGNKFWAIVEYMAKNGWLYDFKKGENGTTPSVFGYKLQVGSTLPSSWANNPDLLPNNLVSVEQANRRGSNDEMERGEKRAAREENMNSMLQFMDGELDDMNYWAALGVMKTIWKKAKTGEAATWSTVAFMNTIRNGTEKGTMMRKYFPIEALDAITFSVLSPVQSPSFIKFEKNKINKWQRDLNLPFEKAGKLAAVVKAVQEDIEQAQREAGRNYLPKGETVDRLIARVLAGQTLDKKKFGWRRSISIFMDKPAYNGYHEMFEPQDGISPKDTDTEFFNEQNDGSEALLGNGGTYGAIFKATTTGNYDNSTHAKLFLDQILVRHDTLSPENDPALAPVQERFRADIEKKMNGVFVKQFSHDASAKLALDASKLAKGKPLFFAEFFRRGLANPRVLIRMLADEKSQPLALKIMSQLRSFPRSKDDPTPFLTINEMRVFMHEVKPVDQVKESPTEISTANWTKALEAITRQKIFTAEEMQELRDESIAAGKLELTAEEKKKMKEEEDEKKNKEAKEAEKKKKEKEGKKPFIDNNVFGAATIDSTQIPTDTVNSGPTSGTPTGNP